MKFFRRNYDQYLIDWKNSPTRKPLLIGGARQVGKTSAVKNFGDSQYKRVLELNFMRDGELLKDIFDDGLAPNRVLTNAQLALGKDFDPDTDLVVFEEIGFSEQALTSLKFFSEDAPEIHLIATGSNVGMFKSYPVGKTERLTMYPMTFREFLMATENSNLLTYVDTQIEIPTVVHKKLMDLITDYWFVGGMPESVKAWISFPNTEPLKRIGAVEKVKSNLLKDYNNDFGKFSKDHDAATLKIKRVYDAVAIKIASVEDGNTPKFKFKGVLPNTSSRYKDIASPVDFLECIYLVHKIYILDGINNIFNMNFQKQENMFKLIPHDVGILTSMIGIGYKEIKAGKDAYKGYIAEVFVINEMIATMIFAEDLKELFSFKKADSLELELLLNLGTNNYVPIEVKSGTNRRSVSLTRFVEDYKPQKAFKFTANNVKNNPEKVTQQLPLYKARAAYVETFQDGEDIALL